MTEQCDECVHVELTDDQLGSLDLLAGRFGVSPEQVLEVAMNKIFAEVDGRSLDPPEQVLEVAVEKAATKIFAELDGRSLDPA